MKMDQMVTPDASCQRKPSTLLHLPYVEVRPLCRSGVEGSPTLTSAFIKTHLMRVTCRAELLDANADKSMGIQIALHARDAFPLEFTGIENTLPILSSEYKLVGFSLSSSSSLGSIATGPESSDQFDNDLLCFPTNDPSCADPWPCVCRGYVRSDALIPLSGPTKDRCAVLVTESTLVRVLPCHTETCGSHGNASWSDQLTGECPISLHDPTRHFDDVLASQNPTAIQELVLRMQRLLAAPVYIGTTADSLQQRRQQYADRIARERKLRSALSHGQPSDATRTDSVPVSESTTQPPNGERHLASALLRDSALLVHSPDHGAGKTELIKAIAHGHLGRRPVRVHVIRPEAMLARYGIHADAALQSVIHAVAMQAAVREQAVCILLDGLEAMLLPPTDKGSSGDAAVPVLHGMASFLQTLTTSLLQAELPFPRNNPLYNMSGHEYGVTLPVQLILVAVMTCPDKRSNQFGTAVSSAMGTYRLSNLSSATRLSAFQWAFAKEGLDISDDLQKRLPLLAASAVWARGAEFRRLARRIRSSAERNQAPHNAQGTICISVRDVEAALTMVEKSNRTPCNVQFSAESAVDGLFDTVGGNEEAKVALYDALALDTDRRRRIETLGLRPATGILLYGPPGTGKTLLAKAVSKVLRSGAGRSSDIGGAFISLSSSDIVQAEVGTSEKLVSAAFQTARANSPSVVFIDEIQALFTERSRGGSGRLSTTLLQCMDDLNQWKDIARKGRQGSDDETNEVRVLVIAATNTPWMLDRSFLRSGRFDRSVHVGLPTASERQAILALYVGRMKVDFASDAAAVQTFCERISNQIIGFSGADISALCRAAAMRCLVEQSTLVREEHFDQVLEDGFRSSSSRALVDRIKKWRP